MDWSKITQTMVHAPEYIGSSPSERGTWLSVLMYCALLENGGRIQGANQWKDRQWQQTCGVTLSEVNETTKLLTWDRDDITVWNYPAEAEEEVKSKRAAGRRGGLTRAANASSIASSIPSSIASTDKIRLDETRKEKKETVNAPSAVAPTTPKVCDTDWLKALSLDPTYSHVDVQIEHGKMTRWCVEHRKLASRKRFINWINRCERPMGAVTPTTPVVVKHLWQAAAKTLIDGVRSDAATHESVIAAREAILAGGREAVNWLNSTLSQDERAWLLATWNVNHRWEPMS